MSPLVERIYTTIQLHTMAPESGACLGLISGGSDSVALAYVLAELRSEGRIGPLAFMHVNHKLRADDSDTDQVFVRNLAAYLDVPLFECEIDIAAEAQHTGENVEALARRERYAAARYGLRSLCEHCGADLDQSYLYTAHTQDDRVENFYMRSIVGTGPGGFRSMRYVYDDIARPCLDVSREDLRDYIAKRDAASQAYSLAGELWREDASNQDTEYFRAYVRHEIVPRAKERNGQLLDVLSRTMNLIAEEDDMLNEMAVAQSASCVRYVCEEEGHEDKAAGALLLPTCGFLPRPLLRRMTAQVLLSILGQDARIESASIDAILQGFTDEQIPRSGYVTNIQGNLAVSANKQGVRIEPMAAFRSRRKRQ